MTDSKIKETIKMLADIKTCLGTMLKKCTYLTRKGKHNIGLFYVFRHFQIIFTKIVFDTYICRYT